MKWLAGPILFLSLCTAACAAEHAPSHPQQLSYVDLVHRLTDLEHLSVLPLPGEKCAQWSSYDRASRYDPATGKYINWSANGDGGGVIRTEGDQQVLAEMEGPGCIWRTWSAAPGPGHVRIFLDGAAEPAIDLPFSGYFDHQNEPFTYPALVHDASRGMNSYVPIPYQKSCKITADKNWGAYYHFTYSTFPAETIVPTFTRALGPQEKAALAAADNILSGGLGKDPAGPRKGQRAIRREMRVLPGQTVSIAHLSGPRAITAFHIRLDPGSLKEPYTTLRNVLLRIRWDGEKQPSVRAPLGDFFGTAPGINDYRSLPLGMTADGFYSYWYMPFARTAEVELVNQDSNAVSLTVDLTTAPLSRPVGELGRFHVRWHRNAFLHTDPERAIDWPMLITQGTGRFCGVMLHIWNPGGGWWGEGDEKFFVDGEKFPSTFGTGSEDYFGYAWSNPRLFQHAFHNQTISDQNRGNISVNRWHIADNVPFQQSFEGDIEKYYPDARPTLYACTAYWYLAPGGSDPYSAEPAAERTGYFKEVRPFVIQGALEGETLKVIEKSGGATQVQELDAFGGQWSRGAHLWWTGARPGDHLTLAVPVRRAGRYELRAQFTRARDYGIVQLSLDGQQIGVPIDLYSPDVIPGGEMSLGTRDLAAGEHRLGIEIIGANEKAVKSFMMGLDYVKLRLAKP